MSPEEESIRQAHASWIRAVNDGDVDRLLALMTDDAVFLNPGHDPVGREEFPVGFATAHEQFHIRCVSEVEQIVVVGEVAYATSHDSLSTTPRAGGGATELAGHRLTIYRRQPDGRWLLARDAHTLAEPVLAGGMWLAPDIVPSIKVDDLAGAAEWLVRVFQFRERSGSRLSWPGGGMTWMEAGNGLFNISTPDPAWSQAAGRERGSFVMKVYVDDVDAHCAHAKAHGAEILSEPEDGFWGGRIYRARDLEGNQWEISQRGRDLAPERWNLPSGVTRE